MYKIVWSIDGKNVGKEFADYNHITLDDFDFIPILIRNEEAQIFLWNFNYILIIKNTNQSFLYKNKH